MRKHYPEHLRAGRVYGLTRQRVPQMETRLFRRMRRRLEKEHGKAQ